MSFSAMRRGELASGNAITENTHPLISIAMCTYHGGVYLNDQLVSIQKQTQRPDELIVCDDGFTDNTVQILERFRKGAQLKIAFVSHASDLYGAPRSLLLLLGKMGLERYNPFVICPNNGNEEPEITPHASFKNVPYSNKYDLTP